MTRKGGRVGEWVEGAALKGHLQMGVRGGRYVDHSPLCNKLKEEAGGFWCFVLMSIYLIVTCYIYILFIFTGDI